MKKFTLFMLLAASIGLLQAQTSPDYIFGSDNGAGWNWTTGTQGTASLGSSYKWQFAATATADHYFKFGETSSNADGSGFWVNGSAPDMNYTGGGAKWTAYYKSNMGDGGAIYTAITTGNYYVLKTRKQAGNDIDFAVFNNGTTAPVTISSVTRTISSNDLTVTATASAAAGANEKIWLRYSKDNWTTSATTEMTLTSGTSYAKTLNCTSGDFVSYYVLTTINQTSAPAETDVDFYTVNYNNNSGKNYTVQIGPFSGNYYIPQGTNAKGFSSLANAFANINDVSLSGTVYLYIDDNLSETGANVLLNRSDLSATNNLIIKPSPAKTPTITFSGCTATAGATQYTGLSLNGTSYVTFDGSNSENGTTKDLTLKMNDATIGRNLIQLFGNCDNIAIKNLVIAFQSPMNTSNTTRGIYLNGQSTGASDNFIVQNCKIGDATLTPYYGVGITGGSGSSIYCTNIIVKENEVYGRIRPVYLYYVGTTGTTTEISNNTIYTYGGANATTTYTIMWNTWGGTLNILNNKLPVLNVANTSGTNGVYGMSGLSSGTGAVVNVINNYVGGNIASTGASVPAVFSLMYIQDNATYNIYNNTFNYQSLTNATEKSNIHISGASCTVNLKNNIIINKTDDSKAYCIWKSNGTLTSDYNNLYVSGANANIGYLSSATTKDRKALADWQTAFTPNQDVHSKSKDVNFVSATDLSLGASIDDIDLAAPAIDMVTTDIFGNDRHTPNVYMGAHEPTNLNDTRTFTVTVPQGTEHVYIAGTFLGKNWNYTDPFELTATANPNEFYGTFPAHSDVQYKYLCNKGDWDYQEAGSVNPLTAASNHTYNANDMVAYWYAMPKVKLNVSINGAVPSNLYVKGGWDNWTTPIALTASSTPLSAPQQKANSESNATMAFTGIIGNGTTDKIPANTEYKYYTTDMTDPNLEANADGSASNNRWTLYPLMNDEIARFTTEIATGLGTTKEVEVVILRTPSGIAVTFDGTATVELYNMKGSLIEKTTATGKYSRDLESGAYIIRINGKATKFVR